MRISDWSSDVCSSDLLGMRPFGQRGEVATVGVERVRGHAALDFEVREVVGDQRNLPRRSALGRDRTAIRTMVAPKCAPALIRRNVGAPSRTLRPSSAGTARSEEHTSELQSLMRNSYAVFCLKKKTHLTTQNYSTK